MECRLERATIHYEETGKGRPLPALRGCPPDGRSMAATIEPLSGRRKSLAADRPRPPRHGEVEGSRLACVPGPGARPSR